MTSLWEVCGFLVKETNVAHIFIAVRRARSRLGVYERRYDSGISLNPN